jgi:hypothetical protein
VEETHAQSILELEEAAEQIVTKSAVAAAYCVAEVTNVEGAHTVSAPSKPTPLTAPMPKKVLASKEADATDLM